MAGMLRTSAAMSLVVAGQLGPSCLVRGRLMEHLGTVRGESRGGRVQTQGPSSGRGSSLSVPCDSHRGSEDDYLSRASTTLLETPAAQVSAYRFGRHRRGGLDVSDRARGLS